VSEPWHYKINLVSKLVYFTETKATAAASGRKAPILGASRQAVDDVTSCAFLRGPYVHVYFRRKVSGFPHLPFRAAMIMIL